MKIRQPTNSHFLSFYLLLKACDIGFTNTVCTIYELINGENTESQEFHSLDEIVMIRALQCLQTQHHAELFEGNIGVKFL